MQMIGLMNIWKVSMSHFRRLRKYIKKYRAIYLENYRDIRHHFYAHRELSERTDIENLFRKTKKRELERIFVFLNQLHFALWRLFHNGDKPNLSPMPYSISSLMRKQLPKWQSGPVQLRIVTEAQEFLKLYAK